MDTIIYYLPFYAGVAGFSFYLTLGRLNFVAKKRSVQPEAMLEYLKNLRFPFNYIYTDLVYGLVKYETLEEKLEQLGETSYWRGLFQIGFGGISDTVMIYGLMAEWLLLDKLLEQAILGIFIVLSLTTFFFSARFAHTLK